MALTSRFEKTFRKRLQREPAFRQAFLQMAAMALISGDVATGKAGMRDYINGTVGFDELSKRTQTPKPALIRMLSPNGKMHPEKMLEVIVQLRQAEGVNVEIQ